MQSIRQSASPIKFAKRGSRAFHALSTLAQTRKRKNHGSDPGASIRDSRIESCQQLESPFSRQLFNSRRFMAKFVDSKCNASLAAVDSTVWINETCKSLD